MSNRTAFAVSMKADRVQYMRSLSGPITIGVMTLLCFVAALLNGRRYFCLPVFRPHIHLLQPVQQRLRAVCGPSQSRPLLLPVSEVFDWLLSDLSPPIWSFPVNSQPGKQVNKSRRDSFLFEKLTIRQNEPFYPVLAVRSNVCVSSGFSLPCEKPT